MSPLTQRQYIWWLYSSTLRLLRHIMGKMVYVMTLVFLFITRLRFPANKSISDIVTARYGRDILQTMRKFEKANFKRRKLELDLDFLNKCYEQKLTPTFLRFRLPNRNLRQSRAYRRCQMDLLRQEIQDKETRRIPRPRSQHRPLYKSKHETRERAKQKKEKNI